MGRKDLSNEDRILLGQFLLLNIIDGKLPRGKCKEVAIKFGITKRCVFKYSATLIKKKRLGLPVCLVSKKAGFPISKRVHCDIEKMKQIKFQNRNTIRSLAQRMEVSKSTVERWKKDGVIRAQTNAIKPALTQVNQFARLKYSVTAVTYDAELKKEKFKCISHVIHMDEKWFFLTKCSERYYIYPGEEEPYSACQSKRFIIKVMFLCAVCRPVYSSDGEMLFDGKIGMWPFTRQEEAMRNSKNRRAGTPITKPIESINKHVTKEMLINQVIPAIKSKWPANSSKDIIIQWDNAPPHIRDDDPEFRAVASAGGFNIKLVFQPANSPDTNINDLGWFRSIQSLKTDVQATTLDGLVKGVQESFQLLSHKTLNKVFISLQACMLQIMRVKGQNNYKIPHLKKDALERMGMLPTDLEVDVTLLRDCIRSLHEGGHSDGLEELMAELGM